MLIPEDERFPYVIECTEWGDDNNGYGDGTKTAVYIQLIDAATGEALQVLPEPINEWWQSKFRLGGYHGGKTRQNIQ